MFQDFSKPFMPFMGGFDELVKVQTRMLEKLATNQLACSKQCLEIHIAQAKKLRECGDPKAAMALQQEYLTNIQNILTQINECNTESVQEAAKAMQALVETTPTGFPPKPDID